MAERGILALLKTMKPLNEGSPEIDDPAPKPEIVFVEDEAPDDTGPSAR
jgi:antitoxin VapB